MRSLILLVLLAVTAGSGCRAFCDCPRHSYYPAAAR